MSLNEATQDIDAWILGTPFITSFLHGLYGFLVTNKFLTYFSLLFVFHNKETVHSKFRGWKACFAMIFHFYVEYFLVCLSYF